MTINEFVNGSNNKTKGTMTINDFVNSPSTPNATSTSVSNSLDSLRKRKKSLENELLNYKRKEENKWWDKEDNIVENVGNVLYKLVGETNDKKYKKDKKYDELVKQYDEVSKNLENEYIKQHRYSDGALGYVEKASDTLAGNIMTGVRGVETSVLKALQQTPDETVTSPSLIEKFAAKARQETSGIAGTSLDVMGSVARMTPQLLVGNPLGARVVGFANYGGGAYNEAINEGYDENQARNYGLAVGSMETILSSVLGTFSNVYGKTKIGSMSQSIIDKFIPKVIGNKQVRELLAQAGGEGFEEFIQEYLDGILKDTLLNEENVVNATLKNISDPDKFTDALYSAFVGTLTGAAMDAPRAISEYKSEKTPVKTPVETQPIVETKETVEEKPVVEKQEEPIEQKSKIQMLSDEELENVKLSAELLGYDTEEIIAEQNKRQEEKKINEEQDKKFIEEAEKMLLDQPTKEDFLDYWSKKFKLKDVDKIINENKFDKLNDNQLLALKTSALLFNYDVSEINSEIHNRKKLNRIKQNEIDNFNKQAKDMLFGYTDPKTQEVQEYAEMFGLRDKIEQTEKELTTTVNKNKHVNPNYDTKKASKIINDINKETSVVTDIKEGNIKQKPNGKYIKQDTSKQKQDTEKLIKPYDKEKVVVEAKKVDGSTSKIIKPNKQMIEKMKEKGFENYIVEQENKLTTKEKREITKKKTYVNKTLQNLIYTAESTGNKELIKFAKSKEAEAMFESVDLTKLEQDKLDDLFEDREDVIEKYNLDIIDGKKNMDTVATGSILLKEALAKGDFRTADKYLSEVIEMGHENAMGLVAMKILYNDSPEGAYYLLKKSVQDAYNAEKKKHKNDKAWIDENNPDNPNSKYHMDEEKSKLLYKQIGKVYGIEDRNSTEYKKELAKLQKLKNEMIPENFWTLVKDFRITNMLFSTRVWLTNLKGELLDIPTYLIDSVVGTPTDYAVKKIFDTEITTKSLSTKGTLEYLAGIKEGYKNVWDAFINDKTVGEFTNRYDVEEGKYSDSTINDIRNMSSKYVGKNKVTKTIVKTVDMERRINTLFMNSADVPVAQAIFASEYYNMAYKNAQTQAQSKKQNVVFRSMENKNDNHTHIWYIDKEGVEHHEILPTGEYENTIKKLKLKELDNKDAIKELALQEASYRTLTDRDNDWVRISLNIKQAVNNLPFKFGNEGLGDLMFAFMISKTNAARALYHHTPFALKDTHKLINNLKSSIAKGDVNEITKDQRALVNNVSEAVAGTAVMGTIACLASTVLRLNGASDDEDKRQKMLNEIFGEKPYSIKIGNTYHSYDFGNILSGLTKISVDLSNAEKLPEDISDLDADWEWAKNTFSPIMNTVLDQTILSNVLEYTDNKYKGVLENIMYKLTSIPSTLVPNMLKDIAVTMDNYTLRDTASNNPVESMLKQIANKIPVVRESLNPKLDVWGNVKQVGQDSLSSFWNTWLGSNITSSDKSSKIDKELMNVFESTNSSDSLPSFTKKTEFKYNGKTFSLDDKQELKYKKDYGKTAYQTLGELFDTKTYKNSDSNEKLKLIKAVYNYSNEEARRFQIEDKGGIFYNYKKDDKGNYTQYRKPVMREVIENDITIVEAQYKRNNPEKYKFITTITGDKWNVYNNATDVINNMKDVYTKENGYTSKQRTQLITSYISKITNLTPIQRVMLSKEAYQQSTYSKYDKEVYNYLKQQNLNKEEMEYAIDKLGLNGYYIHLYKEK